MKAKAPEHPSAVGPVADMATRGANRLLLVSALTLLVGLASAVGCVYALIEWAFIGVVILAPMAWLCLAVGTANLGIAYTGEWFIRAGAGGLSFRVPAIGPGLMIGRYDVVERDLAWDAVKSCRPVPEPNLSPTNWFERAFMGALRVEMDEGEELLLGATAFAEDLPTMATRISQVRAEHAPDLGPVEEAPKQKSRPVRTRPSRQG